jgi:ATP-dependent DNA helicase RecQ
MPTRTASDLFSQALRHLKQDFGYDTFHPTQEKAIKAVLAGKDTFVLMPTGGGKSLCYQIPGLVLPAITIVVSPLIALMKDQVDGLKANGIAAEFLNSSLDSTAQTEITQRTLAGELKILYVSAEKLLSPQFSPLLTQLKPSLFAIDEAHCISAWGHDFRPDYTQLSQLKTRFPATPIIALTATADHSTRVDILKQLELQGPVKLIDSFDRPNISLTVLPGKNRVNAIIDFLTANPNQSGIIYCLSRKQTENLAEKLQHAGYTAGAYHAGMTQPERTRIQQSFVRDRTQIICATIAFGMGIDKSNVRWVIHYNIPKNIEGYYQEIGRAGRDSAPAQSLLLYTYQDIETLKKFGLESTQAALQLGKLDRMKEYAEGVICRRKILLSYFGQHYKGSCGNCDVCANPYPTFDGTELARQALTAVQNDPSFTTKRLVSQLLEHNTSVNFAEWHFYVGQLKNLGLLEVLFDNHQHLALTETGITTLEKNKKVALVSLDSFIDRQEKVTPSAKKIRSTSAAKKDTYNNPLFEILRQERLKLARQKNIAAYMIFSDATLLQMATDKPQSEVEMRAISGVGSVKWQQYGEVFLSLIRENIEQP